MIVKFPLEFFVQIAKKGIDFGEEGVGQGTPDTFKALLMSPSFVFDEINHTFANTGIVRLATPTISSLVETTGTLGAGTYYYRVSAINSVGETLASTEDSVSIGATKGVQITWGAVDGATGYKIFGRTSGAQQLLNTVGAVTTWTDTGALSPSGALPIADSTGEELETGNGYTANDKTLGSLTLQRNIIDNRYEIQVPTITWTPVGTLGPVIGMVIIDSTPASLTDQPIINYYDFGGSKSETAPTAFSVLVPQIDWRGTFR